MKLLCIILGHDWQPWCHLTLIRSKNFVPTYVLRDKCRRCGLLRLSKDDPNG